MTRSDSRSVGVGVGAIILGLGSLIGAAMQFLGWRTRPPEALQIEFVLGSILVVAAFLFAVYAVRMTYSRFISSVLLELGSISLGVLFAVFGGYYLFQGLIFGRSVGDVLLGSALFGTSIAFYLIGFAAFWFVGASVELD